MRFSLARTNKFTAKWLMAVSELHRTCQITADTGLLRRCTYNLASKRTTNVREYQLLNNILSLTLIPKPINVIFAFWRCGAETPWILYVLAILSQVYLSLGRNLGKMSSRFFLYWKRMLMVEPTTVPYQHWMASKWHWQFNHLFVETFFDASQAHFEQN